MSGDSFYANRILIQIYSLFYFRRRECCLRPLVVLFIFVCYRHFWLLRLHLAVRIKYFLNIHKTGIRLWLLCVQVLSSFVALVPFCCACLRVHVAILYVARTWCCILYIVFCPVMCLNVVLSTYYLRMFNPPTDRPFETIQNFLLSKMPIGFVHTWCYHLNSVGSKLYYHSNPFNGFRGSIDSPLRSIQTRFCISCTTIWKDPNKVLYQLTYHSKP